MFRTVIFQEPVRDRNPTMTAASKGSIYAALLRPAPSVAGMPSLRSRPAEQFVAHAAGSSRNGCETSSYIPQNEYLHFGVSGPFKDNVVVIPEPCNLTSSPTSDISDPEGSNASFSYVSSPSCKMQYVSLSCSLSNNHIKTATTVTTGRNWALSDQLQI